MPQFYSNENFPLLTVLKLRELGHDVLTALRLGMPINGSQMKPCLRMPHRRIVPF